MNYFSKNKKWMAYLILLTFLFTSIMPTNLATGDSMAWADDGLCNVVFKDANGDTIANTERTVKAGETTEAPVAPEIANKVFVGWNDGTQTHTGHTLTINADTEFTATYRDLDDVFVQIEYLYEDGSVALPPFEAFVEKGTAYNKTVASPALEGFTAAPATVTINESAISGDIKQTVKYTGANVDYKIEYRQQQLDGTYVVVDTVTGNAKTGTVVESELKEYTGFTPVINAEQQMRLGSGENVLTVDYNRNEYLLTVDTDGGSYIAPAKLKYGAAIAPTAPTKLGYTFNEWKVTGTQNNAPATMPANDLSITAQWTNNATANYTVVYWQQNAKDLTKYDYKESASKTGNVGANATYDAKSYAGFAVKPVTPVTVNADGSTVVNVYYDRINYSIYFWLYQNRNWVKQDNLTITAPYGTDISGQWNDDAHSQYMWYTSQSQTTSIGTQGTMPLNGKFPGLDSYTNNAYGDTTSTVTIYYKEWISNTQSTELGRGKLPSRWTINEGDIIDLEGFTYRSMNKNSKTLYYTRNSYSITFENASGISAATGIPYEKAITSYQPTGTITPPASVDSDYVFGGWYTSPACEKGTEVNWSSTMPAHNQIFYAKWTAPQYTVSFDLNGEGAEGETPEWKVVKYDNVEEELSQLADPTREGYTFAGWYQDSACTIPMVDNRQITGDLTLYAKWQGEEKYTYTVYFVDENENELAKDMGQETPGTTITVDPKPFAGYYCVDNSQTVQLDSDNKEITFHYVQVATWNYTVKYVDEQGNTLHQQKTVENATEDQIVEFYQPIDGYVLISEPSAVLNKDNTEATFKYCPVNAVYTVKHVYYGYGAESAETNTVSLSGKAGTVVTAEPQGKEGYRLVTADLQGVVKRDGTLVITLEYYPSAEIEITADSNNKVYDGQPLMDNGYTYTDGVLAKGDVLTAVVEGKITDAGETANKVKSYQVMRGSVDVTANYNIRTEDGKLTVTKRTVTLTSATDSKVYDGKALTNDTVTVTGDGFATGEGATYTVTGSQTEVGSSANTFTYKLNEGTKAANYEIETVEGTLKVTELTDKVTVTITEHKGSEKYDGTEKTVTGYDVAISNPLYTEKDFTFSGDATVNGTDAGTYNMELKPEDFTNTNKNFSNVEFVIVDGTLEIAKREVTLTSATDSKVYDGKALTNDKVTVGGDGFATGEGAAYDVTGIQTEVGSSANAFTYTLNEGTKADNYTITTVEGTLTVTELTDKVTVTITENSGSEKYDGAEKTVTGYTVAISNPLYTEKDFTFSGNDTVKGTDAGSYDMELKAEDFTNTNKNFSNVEFVIVDGTLKIAKRTVTLTSATDSKVYDGTALTNNEVTVSGDGFVTGEGAAYDVTGTQTEVGSSANTFTYELNKGTKAANYDITKTEGTLTVTELTDKVTVTITENSGSEKYDGAEKTVTGYTVSIDNELYTENDFTFSGDATVKGTDAGSYDMELKASDFTNTNANFNNVEFVIVDGTLEISKRTVTLTSADDEKVYDGTALTNDEVTVSGDGFATGEGVAYDVTGSQTEVGSSANEFTYTLNEGTKAANYEITTVEGTLTVTALTDKVTVTITENSGSEKYDGTEKTVTGYTVSIDNELYTEADFTFSGDATVKGTDAGSYDMELKASDFANINANFNNVEFVIVDGTLEISKRTVTLTSATDSKVYDGEALTNDEVTVSGDGFAEGEGAAYDVTGSQTNVGSSANEFTYKLNRGTKAGNYTITTVEGTLTVTPVTDKVTVTITEHSGEYTYDGTEKTVTGYDVSISNDLYTKEDFSFNGTDSVSGTNVGTYDMKLKAEDFVNNNENFSNVTFVIVDGQLTINPLKGVVVTITEHSGTYTYDGTEKTVTGYDVSISSDLYTEADFSFNGTDSVSGTVVGTYDMLLTAENFTNNNANFAEVEFVIVDGQLNIVPIKAEIVITADSNSKVYDGTPLTDDGYTYTPDVLAAGDVLIATVEGTITDVGTVANKVTGYKVVRGAARSLAEGTDVTANYTFGECIDGTLTVTPREVTLTSATDSKIYDGTALRNATVTVSGDGFVEGEGAAYNVTGAQTNVGTSDNTFTYTLNEGTNAANYNITVVFGTLTVTRNDNAQYKVQYWYQDPVTGKYDIFGGEEMRSTTAGSLAFITEEDTVTTRSMYQFNAELSDTQKTVHVYPVNAETGVQEYTTLNVFFDALYNVVYRYTDGTETYDVASSGYVYGYEDYVIAPGMQSIDQFDGKWYKDAAITDEWIFADDTINGNSALVDDLNTIYLYTRAQVAPLEGNTIRVEKRAYDEPESGMEYLFNLQLIVDAPEFSAPLTSTSAVTLHRYNAAKITAEGEYEDAKAALEKAEDKFRRTVFRTTNSSLDFIMYEAGEALFAIGTTGSAYGYETTPSVYEYNLFEDSFGVEYDSDVEDSIIDQIIDFIKGLVNWRTPLQTLDPEMALYGLQAAGVNTSGSALAFEYEAASDLFLAAKDLIGKEAAYEEAEKALNDYQASVGRIVVITVNGEQFVLNEKDEDGNYIYAQDEDGNFIWSRDFSLTNGAFKDFKVEVSTGSSVQFIITETNDGGADVTRVNGVTTHSVYGFVTTGSTYLFENIFEEEGGGGYTPPYTPQDPPKPPEEEIDDPEVPTTEPEVPEEPVVVPGEPIEEPEVPLGDAPKTGDETNAVPFMALMMFALCGLVITRRKFN